MFQKFSNGGLEKAAIRLAQTSRKAGYECTIVSSRDAAKECDVLISFKGHFKNTIISRSIFRDKKFLIREYNSVNELYLDRSKYYFMFQIAVKKLLWALSDGVIGNSYELVCELVNRNYNNSNNIFYLPNSIVHPEIYRKLDYKIGVKYLYYSGRNNSQKDLDCLGFFGLKTLDLFQNHLLRT